MKCRVESCSRPPKTRGWCSAHYQRWWKSGDLRERDEPRLLVAAIEERFWTKVSFAGEDGCWLWKGGGSHGYGRFTVDASGRYVYAHIWAWNFCNGPVPDGLELDHLCRKTACVRPDHLEPVTHAENIRRGLRGRLVTHCPQGHEYTPENTAIYVGRRNCRTCHRAKVSAYRHRRAEKVA